MIKFHTLACYFALFLLAANEFCFIFSIDAVCSVRYNFACF